MYGTWSNSIPGTYTQDSYTGNVAAEDRTTIRTGTLTPGYMALRKEGRSRALPENAYSFYKQIVSHPKGWFQGSGSPYVGYLSHLGGTGVQSPADRAAFYLPTSSEISGLNSKAITKLRGKLKDSDVNLVQAFAERKQSAQLIGDAAIKMAKMLKSIRKGDLGSAADAIGVTVSKRSRTRHRKIHKRHINSDSDKVMANGVLQLNFGWKPLLSDAYGVAETLQNKVFREVWNEVRTSDTLKVLDQIVLWSPAGECSYADTYDMSYEIRYLCKFAISNDVVHSMSQVGLTNPLLIAWELMPWSFVIDWFIPVGGYISSLDATLGLDFIAGTKTTISTIVIGRHSYQGTPKYVSGALSTCDAKSGYRELVVNRSVLTTFPAPSLPRFKNPYSFLHATEAIALLVQLRK